LKSILKVVVSILKVVVLFFEVSICRSYWCSYGAFFLYW